MKKAAMILLPLALLLPAASCSQKNDPSVADESVVSTITVPEDDYIDPASEGTNYTKGTVKESVYVNEYAQLRMKVPESLYPYTAGILSESKSSFIAGLSDDTLVTRESARIWDAQFSDPRDNVAVSFINTKLAFPDKTEVSVEDVLDYYKDFINNTISGSGTEVKWVEGEKVTVGGQEYTRNTAYYDGSDSNYEALYMRKLDDSLICWLHISSNDPNKDLAYFEGLFE